jgi:hypothetical protein
LFYLAAATQATGRLTLSLPAAAYALGFRKGTVEHASSSAPEDDLGRFLLRKGALSPEALVQAEAARAGAGGDLAAALVAARVVNPADVAGFLQEHGVGLVTRALAGEEGTFRWEPGAPAPVSSFPLGHPFSMFCAAVRALDLAAVKRRLSDREERAASRVGGRVRVEDLRLTPQEARAVALFDGRSPAEIAAAQPSDAAVALRLALLLGESELLAFGEPRKAARPAPAPPPAPAPAPAPARAATTATPPAATPPPAQATTQVPAPPRPAAAARPATTPVPRPATTPAPRPSTTPAPRPAAGTTPAPAAKAAPLDLASLQALAARLADADHFQALGVKEDAPAAQVKVAYFQLARSYHPDAVSTSALPEVKQLAATIFARVSEAWSVLGDEASRAKYLEELRGGGAPTVDVMNILQAENVFQVGTALVKGRRYDEAIAKFDEAMMLNPDEAEFGMWKAWCEFLIADDRKRAGSASTSAIDAGLKRNPRCAQGYLFLGQIAKLLGDASAAEKHLRRGLAVAPDHAELQRELKYVRK